MPLPPANGLANGPTNGTDGADHGAAAPPANTTLNAPLLTNGRASDDDDDGESPRSASCARLHTRLTSHRGLVFATWCALVLLGAAVGPDFIRDSEDLPKAPKGSRAALDKAAFEAIFPEKANQEPIVIMVQCAEDAASCVVACPATRCSRRCEGERADVAAWMRALSESILSWSAAESAARADGLRLLSDYVSYYNVSHTHLDQAKCGLSSRDGKSTLMLFQYDQRLDKRSKHAIIAEMASALRQHLPPAGIVVGVTGPDPVAKEATDESERQMMSVDVFTLPVALALFATMVRSWRLLLLCMTGALVTTVTTFGLLSLMFKLGGTHPLSILATLAEALSLSMSIDYNLFLHRRFRDEIKNGNSVEVASRLMLEQAGEVVLLSCSTFCLVFVGFLFLPSEALNGVGRVCVVTLVAAFLANVSLSVAAIATFPRFFSTFSFNRDSPAPLTGARPAAAALQHDRPPPARTVTGAVRHRRGAPYAGPYYALLRRVTVFPFNVLWIAAAYALIVPLAYQARRLEYNQDVLSIAPRGGASSKVYVNMRSAFDPGLVSPYSFVVVDGPPSASADDRERERRFFDTVDRASEALSRATGVDRKYFLSPVDAQGRRVSYALSRELLNPQSLVCQADPDACALYRWACDRAVSKDGRTVVVLLNVPFDPLTVAGNKFVDAARPAMDAFMRAERAATGTEVYLCGFSVESYDLMKEAFDVFPALLAVTCVIVFALLALGFRGVLVPVRLALTVFLPIAAVFGLFVLVYQDGWLGWTGIVALQKTGSSFWLIPILCCFEALGLVLDYDVFAAHRVYEHRTNGFDTRAAIIKGVWETNSTIIVAGLIMASVFGGLLLSSEPAVDHFGFLMLVAVLFDTLVVQTLLMPAILSLDFGALTFWPRAVPHKGLITLEDPEFAEAAAVTTAPSEEA